MTIQEAKIIIQTKKNVPQTPEDMELLKQALRVLAASWGRIS